MASTNRYTIMRHTVHTAVNAGTQKVRNVTRALLQQYGTRAVKRRLWDAEYASGRWRCLESMPGDCVYSVVERYARGGSVLDLGCGPGTTGSELNAASYSQYIGVDISDVAIEKAKRRAESCRRTDKNRYLQGDIVTFEPDQKFDLILFGDSLYYVSWAHIQSMLNRYASYLNAGGVFVARIYGRRFQKIIDIIERNFEILDRGRFQDEVFVLTFRPTWSTDAQTGLAR
jgi:SAM-dependent methyltransferase